MGQLGYPEFVFVRNRSWAPSTYTVNGRQGAALSAPCQPSFQCRLCGVNAVNLKHERGENYEPRNDERNAEDTDALAGAASSPVLARIPAKTQGSAVEDVRGSELLDKGERGELVEGCADASWRTRKYRNCESCYGMALCVDFEVQDAIEELSEGVRLAPDSFIAQLKMGELWMRLRVIEKAEEHTHQAAMLAQNATQSEMARRQAATIPHPDAQRS